MAGTLVDARGLLAVQQGAEKLVPVVGGIPIGQRCKQLHFLHSAYNAVYSNREESGRY